MIGGPVLGDSFPESTLDYNSGLSCTIEPINVVCLVGLPNDSLLYLKLHASEDPLSFKSF